MKTLIIVVHLHISQGLNEKDLNETGKYKYILKELTRPFELTFEYVKVKYNAPFVFYGREYNISESHLALSVKSYLAFLDKF